MLPTVGASFVVFSVNRVTVQQDVVADGRCCGPVRYVPAVSVPSETSRPDGLMGYSVKSVIASSTPPQH
jgi:hypothetical protein